MCLYLFVCTQDMQTHLKPFNHFRIYKLERKKYFDQMEDVRLRTRHVKAITGFADGSAYYIIFGMGSEVKLFVVQNYSLLV